MDGGAIGQLLAGAGKNLLKVGLRLVELVFLHGAQTCLVILHSLCKTRVVTDRFLGCGLLCHLQNSSCTLRKYPLIYIFDGTTLTSSSGFRHIQNRFCDRRFRVLMLQLWKTEFRMEQFILGF